MLACKKFSSFVKIWSLCFDYVYSALPVFKKLRQLTSENMLKQGDTICFVQTASVNDYDYESNQFLYVLYNKKLKK